jgi:hypothetical protein
MVPARAAALVVTIGIAWVLVMGLLLLLMELVGMLMMTAMMTLISMRMVRNIRIFVSIKQVDTPTAIPWSPRGLCEIGHAVGVMLLVTQTTTRMTAFHGRIVTSSYGTRGTRIAVRLTKLIGRRRQVSPHHAGIIAIALRHHSVDSSLAL